MYKDYYNEDYVTIANQPELHTYSTKAVEIVETSLEVRANDYSKHIKFEIGRPAIDLEIMVYCASNKIDFEYSEQNNSILINKDTNLWDILLLNLVHATTDRPEHKGFLGVNEWCLA